MKKFVSMLLALVMVFALCACGSKTEDGDKAESIKVGFICLHDENSTYDKNFIDAAKAACKNAGLSEDQYIIKTNIPEGQECYNAAAELVDAGCNVVFADSFGHEDFMIQAAKDFPKVQFCHATGTKAHTEKLSNYHNAFASIYEGRYLAGVAAGMKLNEMIEAGKFTADEAKMGYVGAFTYAEVISGYTSFYLGAKSVCPSGIRATVSVGIGRDGDSLDECYNFAILGTEMALSRGGDQAVVKNRVTFEFFGGRGGEVERRTKVKSRVMANALSQLIQDSSKVYVMGHKFSDLDTLGAAAGVCCIARKLGTPCRIVMDANKTAAGQLRDRMLRVPEYGKAFLSPQEAYLHADSRTLLVVVDTNRPDQVENRNLLEACTRVAVIDHHRRAATYITNATMSFHEPYASSACELMAELLEELVEQPDILRVEAEAMLSGIMLDTKDFTVRTGERTFEAAAFLRRAGADTSEVKKLLQTDMEHTVARYKILQTASIYRADIAIAAPTEPQDRIVAAQAADELLNIAGVTASMVIYPMGDGDVFISARSIGELNVQLVMEALGGGGSRSSAAVQLHDVSVAQAVQMARRAIDDNLEN